MTSGIAQILFRNGGVFLPARSPYDREIVMEHVTDRARTAGEAEVLLDGQRWKVQLQRGQPAVLCAHCGIAANPTCYATHNGKAAHCVKCAFGFGASAPSAYVT